MDTKTSIYAAKEYKSGSAYFWGCALFGFKFLVFPILFHLMFLHDAIGESQCSLTCWNYLIKKSYPHRYSISMDCPQNGRKARIEFITYSQRSLCTIRYHFDGNVLYMNFIQFINYCFSLFIKGFLFVYDA